MLELYFNILDYIYNNIFYYYHIYVFIYRISLYIKFYVWYWFNLLNYYTLFNKIALNFIRPFLFIYYFLKKLFKWLNRRFLKKNKRFRVYYKYHNVRYWKFLLFFFYINVFLYLWKKRNLYRKSQFITFLVFLHIILLISLHFFIGFFNSFDIGFLSCIFFFFILVNVIKR